MQFIKEVKTDCYQIFSHVNWHESLPHFVFVRYLGYINNTLGGLGDFSNIIFGSYRNQTQEECICLWPFNYISTGIGKETSFNQCLKAPSVRIKLTCGLYVLNWVLVKLFNLFDIVIQKYFVFFSFSIYLIWLQSIVVLAGFLVWVKFSIQPKPPLLSLWECSLSQEYTA